MEVNGLVHPFLKGVGDFFHGIDHSGDLNVQFLSKEFLDFRSVSHLGLHNQVLKFEEVCLKAIILPGCYLEVVKFTKRCCILKEVSRLGTSDKGIRTQPNKLWIARLMLLLCKTRMKRRYRLCGC